MNIRGFVSALAAALVLLCGAFSDARAAEPEIVGSMRFSNQVHQALVLLRSRDTNAYAIVTNYVGRIQEGKRSGMWADKKPPTFEMSGTTAFYSLTWCAATIAHDSFHSKLYHDHRKAHPGAVPRNVWTGTEAERQCMAHQLLVMARIGRKQGRDRACEKTVRRRLRQRQGDVERLPEEGLVSAVECQQHGRLPVGFRQPAGHEVLIPLRPAGFLFCLFRVRPPAPLGCLASQGKHKLITGSLG